MTPIRTFLLSLALLTSVTMYACDAGPEPVEAVHQALTTPPYPFVPCTTSFADNYTMPLNFVQVRLNTNECFEVDVFNQPSHALNLSSLGNFNTSNTWIVEAKSRTKAWTDWYGVANWNNYPNNYCPWVQCVEDDWYSNGVLRRGYVVGQNGQYPLYHPASLSFYSPAVYP